MIGVLFKYYRFVLFIDINCELGARLVSSYHHGCEERTLLAMREIVNI